MTLRARLLIWSVIAAAAVPFAMRLESRLVPSSEAGSSESSRVAERLARDFDSPFARAAALVVRGAPRGDTEEGRTVLRRIVAALDSIPAVRQSISPATLLDTLLVGSRSGASMVLVGLDSRFDAGEAVDSLRSASERTRLALAASYPDLELLWTGEAALNRDLRRFGSAEARRAELRGIPIVFLVGWWAFGGLLGAFVAAACGSLAMLVSLGIAGAVATVVPLTPLAQNIVSLLALTLGTDYALLLMWRGRETAGAESTRQGRRMIALAGAAVAAGLAPLMVFPVTEVRSAGIAAFITVVVAVAVSVTVTPGAAVHVARTDAGSRSSGRWHAAVRDRGERSYRRWSRWAGRVTRRPWPWLGAALLPLLLLCVPATRARPVVQGVDWLPDGMEAGRALRVLEQEERRGSVLGLRLILDLPGALFTDSAGWAALGRLSTVLEADPRVASVRSLQTAAGGLPAHVARDVLPAEVRATFLSRDARSTVIELAPARSADGDDVAALVRDLRAMDLGGTTGMTGAHLEVGGIPAFNLDYAASISRLMFPAAAAAVAACLLVLLAGFALPLIAIKAVVLNLLSVFAAVGAAVLVFQDGHLGGLFGLPAPLGGLFPTILVLAFCVVFGVSMDYEVFLVARIAEERKKGLGERAAIAEGVGRSAGVITGAAAVMVSVFAAFAMSDLAPMRLMGFLLAVAIAIDATLIRLVLAPALLSIAGRWNWWPGSRYSR